MRSKLALTMVVLILFILTMPVFHAMQMQQAETPKDMAYVTGRVTYNGNYQDGVSLSIPGGSSDKTKDGGYYKLAAFPNLVVSITASYKGVSKTRSVEAEGEGSIVTYNFDLTSSEYQSGTPTVTPTPVPQTIVMIGTIRYDGNPLTGALVNISPVKEVRTDSSGQYMVVVPEGQNLTISVETAKGSISKNVTSPTEGTSFVVDLNYTSPAPTVTVTVTPVVPSDTISVSPVPTGNGTPTPASVPAGNESLAILSVIGFMAIIGLLRQRK